MKFLKQLLYSALATSGIIFLVVLLMVVGIVPYSSSFLGKFLLGSLFLVLGQATFLIAIDGSIIKVGKMVGSALMKKRNVWLIVIFGFLFGFVTTLAEPDVQVLVSQIVGINSFLSAWFLVSICGIGCGVFVAVGFMTILKNIPLKWLLFGCYALILGLGVLAPNMYFGIAFDMSAVTTGSLTVPFILALATGLCAIRGKNSASDTFGLIAITSIGPLFAMMILGIALGAPAETVAQTVEASTFGGAFLTSLTDVALAFLPLFIIFLIANFCMLRMSLKSILKVSLGFIVSAFGLIVFLTGIRFGFSEMGYYIGQTITSGAGAGIVILFGAVLGILFVFTDPSIVVVVKQVEDITLGLLRKRTVFIALGLGIALAISLAFMHILFQIPLIFIIVPALMIELALNFVIPKMFSALAFDCGGVASGTLSVAFVFPICVGLTQATALGPEFSTFGIVGIIAILPIMVVQLLGVVYMIKQKRIERRKTLNETD